MLDMDPNRRPTANQVDWMKMSYTEMQCNLNFFYLVAPPPMVSKPKHAPCTEAAVSKSTRLEGKYLIIRITTFFKENQLKGAQRYLALPLLVVFSDSLLVALLNQCLSPMSCIISGNAHALTPAELCLIFVQTKNG